MPPTAVMLVTALLVGGCGGVSPPASPTAGAETTDPAVAPSAPAATPAGPTLAPTPIARPAFAAWSAPSGRSAQLLDVGTDGTVYLTTFVADVDGRPTDGDLVALGPDGAPRTDWAGPALPDGTVVQDAIAEPGGGLYVAAGPPDSAAGGFTTVMRLASDGSTTPGWPVTIPAPVLPSQLQVSDDAVAFLWSEEGATDAYTLERIRPDGTRPPGWPVLVEGTRVRLGAAGADGRLYLDVPPVGDPWGPTKVLAWEPDGTPVAGWTPFKTKAGDHALILPLSSGLVAVTYGMGIGAPDGFTWLTANGSPAGASAKGPKDMGSPTITVGAGDIVYAGYYSIRDAGMTGPGRVIAFGPDGGAPPGWPMELEGWPSTLVVGQDGTIWVLEVLDPASHRVQAYAPDGTALLAQPTAVGGDAFTTIVAGPDSDVYVTDRTEGTTLVRAVSIPGV